MILNKDVKRDISQTGREMDDTMVFFVSSCVSDRR